MAKVYIGVGHGGKDSGAVGNGFKEKDLNLSIALHCRDFLQENGVKVKMSRTDDSDFDLNKRIKECNAFNPDVALDLHNNAGGGDGAEVFYYHGGGVSKTLAVNILDEIKEIGQNSRGIKTKLASDGSDYFGFIRETKAPAVIVECAFVDNTTDISIVDTEEERKSMGVAIGKGILKTLNIAWIDAKPTLTGYLDVFNADGSYGGWAKWSNGITADVEIYAKKVDGNEKILIGETKADDYRSDVGDCAYNGFADISKLDTGDYIITAYVDNMPLNNTIPLEIKKVNVDTNNKENADTNENKGEIKEDTTQTKEDNTILGALRHLLQLILKWVVGEK